MEDIDDQDYDYDVSVDQYLALTAVTAEEEALMDSMYPMDRDQESLDDLSPFNLYDKAPDAVTVDPFWDLDPDNLQDNMAILGMESQSLSSFIPDGQLGDLKWARLDPPQPTPREDNSSYQRIGISEEGSNCFFHCFCKLYDVHYRNSYWDQKTIPKSLADDLLNIWGTILSKLISGHGSKASATDNTKQRSLTLCRQLLTEPLGSKNSDQYAITDSKAFTVYMNHFRDHLVAYVKESLKEWLLTHSKQVEDIYSGYVDMYYQAMESNDGELTEECCQVLNHLPAEHLKNKTTIKQWAIACVQGQLISEIFQEGAVTFELSHLCSHVYDINIWCIRDRDINVLNSKNKIYYGDAPMVAMDSKVPRDNVIMINIDYLHFEGIVKVFEQLQTDGSVQKTIYSKFDLDEPILRYR